MSNLIVITSTKFVGVDGTESHGWRVRDDHGKAFDDGYTHEEAKEKFPNDLALFQELMNSEDREVVDIIDSVNEHHHSVVINGNIYSWAKISHLFCDGYDGECPDCGEDLPENWQNGDECENCGHVFYY